MAFKVDPIKSHGLSSLICGTTLQEGKVLVSVDMASQDRVALCLSQTRQVHLLVKEVNHLLLGEAEGDVSNIDPPGLTSDGGSHHRHCRLWGVWHQTSRNLSSSLHRLVLHGGDVLKAWGRHIPVQGGLAPLCLGLTVSGPRPPALCPPFPAALPPVVSVPVPALPLLVPAPAPLLSLHSVLAHDITHY